MSLSDELERLANLRSAGTLNEEEYTAAKQAAIQGHSFPSSAGAATKMQPSSSSRANGSLFGRVILFSVLLVLAWLFVQGRLGTKAARTIVATTVRAPI